MAKGRGLGRFNGNGNVAFGTWNARKLQDKHVASDDSLEVRFGDNATSH